MNKLTFQSKEEELQFFKSIIDRGPAFIMLNQVDDLYDPKTNCNIWANQTALDYLSYSREEIDRMGFDFFRSTMHPDDIEMVAHAISKFDSTDAVFYGGVFRIKPKFHDYKWVIGLIMVWEFKNGIPWRFLNVNLEIDQLKDTQNQIITLTKENLQLKNKLIISSLTKREKQIIKYIVKGLTDREIATELNISHTTTKTHRHNISRKLALKNAAAIVHFAMENGLD